MDDPGGWPPFVWVVVALGLGSFVAVMVWLLWRGIFGRSPGWILDSLLLGSSGFVLVCAEIAYISVVANRVPKDWQRLGGYLVLGGVGLPLAWASGRIRRWRIDSRRRRMFGSAKGEFTVPDDFNDPLPKEIEDLFYK